MQEQTPDYQLREPTLVDATMPYLIEHEDEVFVGRLFPHVFLHQLGAGAHGVPGVQHLYHHVRGIDHLVQLAPNAPALPHLEIQKEIVVIEIALSRVGSCRR